ncbi:hypothetical protein [Rhodococcus sp. A14]|uniref:hypothetical protein n=1 Tax=Rhodococcus sp. A14 TaxID=1194106 RepID=UPI0014210782|nr:hypothetical protein [Rhodococcus sp. A14]
MSTDLAKDSRMLTLFIHAAIAGVSTFFGRRWANPLQRAIEGVALVRAERRSLVLHIYLIEDSEDERLSPGGRCNVKYFE